MICAIIPTYNNAATLADIVVRTAQYIPDIIVVADGCTDNTMQVLQEISVSITIVSYERNRGKGYALKQGFIKAKELGFIHALTIDSDGQHFPEDIPALLRVSKQQPECFVVGNRNIAADGMPRKNTFANRFSNFWFAVQTGMRLPDTQTGMRIYPLNRLHGLKIITTRYESELELLVFAAWAGEKIVSVPIKVNYPPEDKRVSHFRPAYDFTRISILNTILCFVAIIYGLPRRWWRGIIYGPWFLFCWLIGLIVTLCCILLKVRHNTYRKLFSYGAKVLISTFPASPFKVIRTKEAVSTSQPAIYIANHTSLFDILACVSLHHNLTIITQGWVFNNPFFALIAKMTGFVSVKEGYEQIASLIEQEFANGASVLIFPEGARSRNGVISRFHKGAFQLSQDLNMPIQPVLIEGMFRMMSKGELFIGKTTMTATLLPAIMPDDKQWGEDADQRRRNVQKYYEHLLTKY